MIDDCRLLWYEFSGLELRAEFLGVLLNGRTCMEYLSLSFSMRCIYGYSHFTCAAEKIIHFINQAPAAALFLLYALLFR